ncbi:MAG: hypothetical protein JSS90_04400 [Bacteroidetes bacterium]|jgi:hypothetical protein|nr:hypothetical protein [Bacteroidota bacterium]
MKYKIISFLLLFICCVHWALAQTDSTKKKLADKLVEAPVIVTDTTVSVAVKDTLSIIHSPRKATIYSAILPGLGQAYNRKYWKIPVIYGLGGLLTYFVVDNNKQYVIYKNAFKDRLDGDPSTVDPYVNIYSDDDLRVLKNYYRRNRDLAYIGMGVTYILNIIDAAVDAHLFYFDVSDDLTLKAEPAVAPIHNTAFAGVRLTLQIK